MTATKRKVSVSLDEELVLDAEALSSLSGRQGQRFSETRAALEAARRLRRDVVVPAVILAELYRGPKQNQVVDSCLSRETGLDVRDTDRDFARLVGGVLSAAEAGSEDLADAHCIAAAVDAGGGVVLTRPLPLTRPRRGGRGQAVHVLPEHRPGGDGQTLNTSPVVGSHVLNK